MPGFDNGVVYGNNIDLTTNLIGTASPTMLTDGQLLIAHTALNAGGTHIDVGTLTSPLGTISVGYSNPNITLDLAGGGAVQTITGNTGGPESPLAGNFNILGTGSITVAGSAHTETVQLTGLTLNSVLYGLGTATIGLVAPTNNGVLTTGTTGTPVITALTANGQLIIGSASGAPIAATLTAGTGVTITNAANSITITATGGSFAWVDVTTTTQTLAAQTGYVTDHINVTYTLPASGTVGDTIKIVGKLGIATITPNANQQILIGSNSGSVGVTGTAVSSNFGDCIELICITAGASTVWRADFVVGTWTLN